MSREGGREGGAREFKIFKCHRVHSFLSLQVCSNHNETFATDCDLYRKRCLCEESDAGDDEMGATSACGEGNMYNHVHVEYYGDCSKDSRHGRCCYGIRSIPIEKLDEGLFSIITIFAPRYILCVVKFCGSRLISRATCATGGAAATSNPIILQHRAPFLRIRAVSAPSHRGNFSRAITLNGEVGPLSLFIRPLSPSFDGRKSQRDLSLSLSPLCSLQANVAQFPSARRTSWRTSPGGCESGSST